ncbi:MBL fold metallo-hydrolase [Rhodohalobacter halophilus]|uniref:MBL fold metallo-hydrolase n=1 Tax=Rhodohalobacter halophilus TaxID=1812810 RepID=UPI00083FD716|nr:MBL fold metallo-hydrolase [Rhodohalobacter halophilus]
MDVKQYAVGPFAENTYLLTQNHQSILIDPGFFDPREFTVFESDLEELGSELVAVCLTHAHVDHIMGLNKVLNEFDVPVYLNHSDLYLWNQYPDQALRFGIRTSGFDFTPKELPEQESFSIGGFLFDVLYTPGHSPDHVSLYFPEDQLVIAGDALFRESIGRTDLYKADFDLLAKSIREKLYKLPEETKVLSGHGPSTTIGHEMSNNNFVKG